MDMVRHLRTRVGAVPRAFVRREARHFLHAAKTCRTAQTRTLLSLLALNGGSRFSRDHRLDGVRTVSQFRRRLPVADYEYFRPYIEEVKAGRTDSLLGPKNRLLMFSLTSGTTGQSKYIPITERFLSRLSQRLADLGNSSDRRASRHQQPHILQLSSDYDLFRTPGGTPCGNISGLVAACQKRIIRTMYTVPGVVSKIRDSDAKLYTAMRLAIADRHIGMVMTANPSTLIQLAKLADARKEDLIRDIADGTLSLAENVPGEVREAASPQNLAPGSGAGPRARSDRRSHRQPAAQAISGPKCNCWRSGPAAARELICRTLRALLRGNPRPRSRTLGQRRTHDDPRRRSQPRRHSRRHEPLFRVPPGGRIRPRAIRWCWKPTNSRKGGTTTSC